MDHAEELWQSKQKLIKKQQKDIKKQQKLSFITFSPRLKFPNITISDNDKCLYILY